MDQVLLALLAQQGSLQREGGWARVGPVGPLKGGEHPGGGWPFHSPFDF